MSVEYNSGIVFGWKVSAQEHEKMNAATDHEYEDDFICIDSWRSSSDYIFGIWIHQCNGCGEAVEINVLDFATKIPDDFMGKAAAKLRHMGKGEWFDDEKHPVFPKLYLVGQVC